MKNKTCILFVCMITLFSLLCVSGCGNYDVSDAEASISKKLKPSLAVTKDTITRKPLKDGQTSQFGTTPSTLDCSYVDWSRESTLEGNMYILYRTKLPDGSLGSVAENIRETTESAGNWTYIGAAQEIDGAAVTYSYFGGSTGLTRGFIWEAWKLQEPQVIDSDNNRFLPYDATIKGVAVDIYKWYNNPTGGCVAGQDGTILNYGPWLVDSSLSVISGTEGNETHALNCDWYSDPSSGTCQSHSTSIVSQFYWSGLDISASTLINDGFGVKMIANVTSATVPDRVGGNAPPNPCIDGAIMAIVFDCP